MKNFLDKFGKFVAVALVLVWIVLLANAQWGFLDNYDTVLKVLNIIRNYGGLALMGLVGMEAVSETNFIVKIIFYAMLAIIVIFLFFPDTYSNLIALIPQA